MFFSPQVFLFNFSSSFQRAQWLVLTFMLIFYLYLQARLLLNFSSSFQRAQWLLLTFMFFSPPAVSFVLFFCFNFSSSFQRAQWLLLTFLCFFLPVCRQGDPEEITRQYHETKTRYLAIQKDVKSFKKFIQVESGLSWAWDLGIPVAQGETASSIGHCFCCRGWKKPTPEEWDQPPCGRAAGALGFGGEGGGLL